MFNHWLQARVSHADRFLLVNCHTCVTQVVRLNHVDRLVRVKHTAHLSHIVTLHYASCLVRVNRKARPSHVIIYVVITDHFRQVGLLEPF